MKTVYRIVLIALEVNEISEILPVLRINNNINNKRKNTESQSQRNHHLPSKTKSDSSAYSPIEQMRLPSHSLPEIIKKKSQNRSKMTAHKKLYIKLYREL